MKSELVAVGVYVVFGFYAGEWWKWTNKTTVGSWECVLFAGWKWWKNDEERLVLDEGTNLEMKAKLIAHSCARIWTRRWWKQVLEMFTALAISLDMENDEDQCMMMLFFYW